MGHRETGGTYDKMLAANIFKSKLWIVRYNFHNLPVNLEVLEDSWTVVAFTFDPNTQEAETGGYL